MNPIKEGIKRDLKLWYVKPDRRRKVEDEMRHELCVKMATIYIMCGNDI